MKIEKFVINEKFNRIDYDYRVGDKVMIVKKKFKYETPLKVPYEKFQTWKNGTVTLQTERSPLE